MLEPLGDMECNVSSSFFGTELASSKDFASFSVFFIDLFSAIQVALCHNHAVLTPTYGTGESGG